MESMNGSTLDYLIRSMNCSNAASTLDYLMGSTDSSNAASALDDSIGSMGLCIRPVTAENMESEMDAIASLLPRYPIITIHTESPRRVVHPRPPAAAACLGMRPCDRYTHVKSDVDALPVVRLGITLCDEHGNIPLAAADGRPPSEIAWEVTISDDLNGHRDGHAAESVAAFLRSQSLDFDHARARGVSSAAFGAKLAAVLSATPQRDELTWAAYGGAHDFAYLVKMLAGGRPLPETTWHDFMAEAKAVLGGGGVFDAKYMMWHCERAVLLRGLGGMAASLCERLKRDVPGLPYRRQSAAQKSHTACLIYTAMRRPILEGDGGAMAMAMLEGLINGLQW